jgi:hypothetical protein
VAAAKDDGLAFDALRLPQNFKYLWLGLRLRSRESFLKKLGNGMVRHFHFFRTIFTTAPLNDEASDGRQAPLACAFFVAKPAGSGSLSHLVRFFLLGSK